MYQRTALIYNLTAETKKTLHDYCSRFGSIENLLLTNDPNSSGNKWAVVVYTTEKGACELYKNRKAKARWDVKVPGLTEHNEVIEVSKVQLRNRLRTSTADRHQPRPSSPSSASSCSSSSFAPSVSSSSIQKIKKRKRLERPVKSVSAKSKSVKKTVKKLNQSAEDILWEVKDIIKITQRGSKYFAKVSWETVRVGGATYKYPNSEIPIYDLYSDEQLNEYFEKNGVSQRERKKILAEIAAKRESESELIAQKELEPDDQKVWATLY